MIVALAVAGLVNMAMVMMASSAFHAGHSEVAEIETAYHTLTPLLGAAAAGVFLVSLIASGVSSSVVGTMAGQMIMQGFVGFRIPIWVRRLVTMVPAFVVVALGVNATLLSCISQVILSIALPVPMIALVIFTRRADIMGKFANGRLTDVAAIVAATVSSSRSTSCCSSRPSASRSRACRPDTRRARAQTTTGPKPARRKRLKPGRRGRRARPARSSAPRR